MAKIHCFPALLLCTRRKNKDPAKAVNSDKEREAVKTKTTKVPNELVPVNTKIDAIVPFESHGSSPVTPVCDQKVLHDDCMDEVERVAVEASYEGGDEHDDVVSVKKVSSFFDLQAQLEPQPDSLMDPELMYASLKSQFETNDATADAAIENANASDPGVGQSTALWGAPILKRSCSNIERRVTKKFVVSHSKSLSSENIPNTLIVEPKEHASLELPQSPLSVITSCSADKIMLKKHSSSQVLPSRSRKLWWRLFLWSHRNMHRSRMSKPARIFSITDSVNKKCGYHSDTLDQNNSHDAHAKGKNEMDTSVCQNVLWPHNQWVAFSAEASPYDRVNAWVNTLEDISSLADDDEDLQRKVDIYSSTFEIGESSGKNQARPVHPLVEEVLQANNIVQSLNALSSEAHISGMGLKVIPAISAFSSLRSVNLSSNLIVHIAAGNLPKSLHTLDLSRNKITSIEGLKELTRLRVLNLSYNKISRIGHGLANCTLIKELYLAGNKISYVEGLHRLLKLTVLDISFNKITTDKSLGQLVANYNSLLALNLLGNPVQRNIGDDQLLKAVMGLLPHLTYFNKQPIKPQRARELVTDSVAKAALGNGARSSRRRGTARRSSQGIGISSRGHSSGNGSRQKMKGSRHHSPSRKR